MRVGLTAVAVALALVSMTAVSGCVNPLADLGPLEERYSGPPMTADAAVADLTSALAEAGIQVRRMPQEYLVIECHEYLSAEHATDTADAAAQDAFEKAKARGWRTVPPALPGGRSLRKANWTAHAASIAPVAGEPTTSVSVGLQCDGGTSKKLPGTESTGPASPSAGP
ncbi:hypothetical protein ACWGHM_08585 [Streptomyces sp. NPDC054904]|uniref:hypothetical protein n=1 Tax=unclassified Streptomyces TaxID=2593676 RepID=UPI0024820F82|nr:hypothetical protein [Streptomyces sp. Isolate_45]MDA5282868.1 hypothetical protein [Streptomyces sp. Isolate_45]